MKLSDFNLLKDGQDHEDLLALIRSFNNNATDYPRDGTVQEVFSTLAARTPDRVAVIGDQGAYTYGEVEHLSDRLAGLLVARGLRPESVVGVMLDGALELIATLLGVLKAGGAYLPLDHEVPAARLRYMLRDAGVKTLVSEKRFVGTFNRLQWECGQLRDLVCMDSYGVHREIEPDSDAAKRALWELVGADAVDAISAGGWRSSYTGALLGEELMQTYGQNVLDKLRPFLGPHTRVLEIGCSSGLSMFRIAPLVGYYCGTDLSDAVLDWTRGETRRRGLDNVRLLRLSASELERLSDGPYDLVVMNSVVDWFAGHNYLRDVLDKSLNLLGDRGVVFLGHLPDQDLKEEFEASLLAFRHAHAGEGVRTKTDRSEDLFLSRAFLADLRHELPQIARLECSAIAGVDDIEFSRYRFDALIEIDKSRAVAPTCLPARSRFQLDLRDVEGAPPLAAGARKGHPRSLAYVMYTSGTTGEPKGVQIEHRAILRLVLGGDCVDLGPQTRILQTGSVAFDASTFEIWGALLNGGCLCCPPEKAILDAKEVKRLIATHGITTMWLTASLLNQLVDADIRVLSGLKVLVTGGEKLSVHHVNKINAAYPKLVLVNGYGPTENTTFTTCHRIEVASREEVPIGRPIANTAVLILDEQGELVPVGLPGEICTAGDGLARGYLGDAALTALKFIAHPCDAGERLYRTGDLGRWRADGTVDYLGRTDDQVKIRGHRIEPGEIEHRMRSHEGVRHAVVVAREIGPGVTELHGYVTGDRAALDERDLCAHLEATLPEYMVPAQLTVLDAFPVTPNGKVDRRALPLPSRRRFAGGRPRVPPGPALERALTTIWEEVLGHAEFGVTDDFFEFGGHSLKVTKLISLVERQLGVALPLGAVFAATTIREQVQCVLDHARFGVAGIDEQMVRLGRGSGGRLVFALPPGTGDALGYVQLAARLEGWDLHAFNFIEQTSRLDRYADLIAEADGDGPHVLLGYSAGGNLAYQVAGVLERRGAKVRAVVMLDAGRILAPLRFPEGEVERVAAAFLGHESVRLYLSNDVLREKAYRRIERYYEYLAGTTDEHTLGADIHLLRAPGSADLTSDEAGHPLSSKLAWAEVTRGEFRLHDGAGEHHAMLHEPYLERNAALLLQVLNKLEANGQTRQ